MKHLIVAGIVTAGIVAAALSGVASEPAAEKSAGEAVPVSLCPIAAGVWYRDAPKLPEKPMRYYRARCWPGCHSGSDLGMYPDDPLEGDRPIWPTSTVPAHHPQVDTEG